MSERSIKVTVVGDGTVGKTCLMWVYANGSFPRGYVPTVYDVYMSSIELCGRKYQMSLWDTAGQEAYDRVRLLTYPNTDVFIVCYSIDNRTSYENIEIKWIPELRSQCPKVPIILVGTKADKRDERSNRCNLVETREGQRLAKRIRAAKAMECSALNNDNVRQVFQAAVSTALKISTNETPGCAIL